MGVVWLCFATQKTTCVRRTKPPTLLHHLHWMSVTGFQTFFANTLMVVKFWKSWYKMQTASFCVFVNLLADMISLCRCKSNHREVCIWYETPQDWQAILSYNAPVSGVIPTNKYARVVTCATLTQRWYSFSVLLFNTGIGTSYYCVQFFCFWRKGFWKHKVVGCQ